jgi:hypothetical protein
MSQKRVILIAIVVGTFWTNQAGAGITLENYIWEVLGLSLNKDTNYPDWDFFMVFLSLLRQNSTSGHNHLQIVPNSVFIIILPLNAV